MRISYLKYAIPCFLFVTCNPRVENINSDKPNLDIIQKYIYSNIKYEICLSEECYLCIEPITLNCDDSLIHDSRFFILKFYNNGDTSYLKRYINFDSVTTQYIDISKKEIISLKKIILHYMFINKMKNKQSYVSDYAGKSYYIKLAHHETEIQYSINEVSDFKYEFPDIYNFIDSLRKTYPKLDSALKDVKY